MFRGLYIAEYYRDYVRIVHSVHAELRLNADVPLYLHEMKCSWPMLAIRQVFGDRVSSLLETCSARDGKPQSAEIKEGDGSHLCSSRQVMTSLILWSCRES